MENDFDFNFDFEFDPEFSDDEREYFMNIIADIRKDVDAVSANPLVWKSVFDFKSFLINHAEIESDQIRLDYNNVFNVLTMNVIVNTEGCGLGIAPKFKGEFDTHFSKCWGFSVTSLMGNKTRISFSYEKPYLLLKKKS